MIRVARRGTHIEVMTVRSALIKGSSALSHVQCLPNSTYFGRNATYCQCQQRPLATYIGRPITWPLSVEQTPAYVCRRISSLSRSSRTDIINNNISIDGYNIVRLQRQAAQLPYPLHVTRCQSASSVNVCIGPSSSNCPRRVAVINYNSIDTYSNSEGIIAASAAL